MKLPHSGEGRREVVMKYLGRIMAVCGILLVFAVAFVFFTSVEKIAKREESRLQVTGEVR